MKEPKSQPRSLPRLSPPERTFRAQGPPCAFPSSTERASPTSVPPASSPSQAGCLVLHQPEPTPPSCRKQAGKARCITLGSKVWRLQSQSESLPP